MISKKQTHLLIVFFGITLFACVVSTSPGSVDYDQMWSEKGVPDHQKVGLVELINPNASDVFNLPVIPIRGQLVLKFDLLNADFQYLSLKVFHCDYNWKKSLLNDLEFLEVYNEFPIRTYDFSQTNYAEYTSYKITVPQVKLAGNYILVVYDEDDNNILFTRRFSVYENKVQVSAQISRADQALIRNTHHQIEYEVNYGDLNVINPNQDIRSVIVQNNDWSRSIDNLEPVEINTADKIIRYEGFANENTLPAGNEFRFFDTRRISNKGLNVKDQYLISGEPNVFLETDIDKQKQAYAEPFQEDLNGMFRISNQDPLETPLNTEYVNVNFELDSDPIPGRVYITGRFNNWQRSDRNMLLYDTASSTYKAQLRLKQGYYNYRYDAIGEGVERDLFEGSHFQTRNLYEVYIYHREPGTVADKLVGYGIF